MTEEQRKKTEKKIMFLSFGVLGLAVVFLIFIGVTGLVATLPYQIILGGILAVYWAVADVLPIYWLNIFEGKTEEQKKGYWLYALLDAGSYAGLVYFIYDMESTIGVLVYAACTVFKRRFREQYEGKTEADEESEEAEDDEEALVENGSVEESE